MTKYFVWVANTHGRPEGQIWFGEQKDGNGKVKATLAKHEMSEEEGQIGIRALAEKYPYENKPD